MMSCDEALELISLKVDGALTGEQEQALAEHLTQCTACQCLLDDLMEIHGAFPELMELPPPGLADAVMQQIHEEKITPFQAEQRRWKGRSWAALAAVLAVVLLGAGTLRLWQDSTTSNASGSDPMLAQAQSTELPGTASLDVPEHAPAPEQAEAGTPADTGPVEPALDSNLASSQMDTITGDTPALPAEPDDKDQGTGGISSRSVEPMITGQSEDLNGSSLVGDDTPPEPMPNAVAPAYGLGPTSEPDSQEAPGLMITSAYTGDEGSREAYCGILTLPYGSATGLEELPYIEQGGERRYTVPAEQFTLLAESLSALPESSVTVEGAKISPDATVGLIIVTGIPVEPESTPAP